MDTQKDKNQRRERRKVLLSFFLITTVIFQGCHSHRKVDIEKNESESPELAPYMGQLQRYTQKLGLSIEAKNHPLATFYAEEMEETLENVKKRFEEYEGMPIRKSVKVIMDEPFQHLVEDLKSENWKAISKSYRTVIESCNRCHAATEHEFIEILSETTVSPFNQRF